MNTTSSSRTWDEDDEGRDNHARAKRLNEGLQKLQVKTWFDDEQMQGNILQRMAEGIERSAVVLICVSRKYMEKVNMDGSNNCKLEFEYAYKKRTSLCMLPVVMEESMSDTATWHGVLALVLGNHLYCKLTSDVDADFECAVAKIAESVDKVLQKALPNEMQSAATALRRWRLCELLLVAFMKDKIAPCPDDEIAETLEVWQEKCEDPAVNLITAFSELMLWLKPSVLNDIGYDFAESSRQNHTRIFVIDWMVQHSKSALPRAKKDEWIKEVVLDWFVSGNGEKVDVFLERAEKFLQKGVKGESWGARIFGKVIQRN
jgi:hypothetical protein